MRIVYRAENLVDAHLLKDALEQSGIPAFVSGEYLVGGIGQLPARDLITVSVPEVCLDAAEPVVREWESCLEKPQSEQPQASLAPGLQPKPA